MYFPDNFLIYSMTRIIYVWIGKEMKSHELIDIYYQH